MFVATPSRLEVDSQVSSKNTCIDFLPFHAALTVRWILIPVKVGSPGGRLALVVGSGVEEGMTAPSCQVCYL